MAVETAVETAVGTIAGTAAWPTGRDGCRGDHQDGPIGTTIEAVRTAVEAIRTTVGTAVAGRLSGWPSDGRRDGH